MAEKVLLDENVLEDVTGGRLHCDVTPNGATLYQYNEKNVVIGKWAIKPGHAMDVYKAMSDTYWSFDPGKRDEQCLAYFKANNWI